LQQQHKNKRKENRTIKSGKKPPKKSEICFISSPKYLVEAAAIVAAATPDEAHTADAMSSAQTATKRPCKRVREDEGAVSEREREREDARVQRAALNAREIGRERHTQVRFFSFFGVFWGDIVG
jgi:hypothetical protein